MVAFLVLLAKVMTMWTCGGGGFGVKIFSFFLFMPVLKHQHQAHQPRSIIFTNQDTIFSCGKKCFVNKTLFPTSHVKSVNQAAFSPSLFALASFDNSISIYSFPSLVPISTITGHDSEVKSISFSFNNQYLATCGRDKTVWIWEIIDQDFECVAVLQSHSQDVKKVLFHPTTNLLTSCSYDNTICIYEMDIDEEWFVKKTISNHSNTVWDIAFNKDASLFASVSSDLSCCIYKDFKPILQIHDLHSRDIYSCVFINSCILTASADGRIAIVSLLDQDGDLKHSIDYINDAHDQEDVNCLAVSPFQDNVFASCGDDDLVKVWSLV